MVSGILIGETFDASAEWEIDPDTLRWQDLSVCRGIDTNLFYDDYESDEMTAITTDATCKSCPVRKQCLTFGVENYEWGVWGGVYLVNGKMDENKNAHKTEEDWNDIRVMLSE